MWVIILKLLSLLLPKNKKSIMFWFSGFGWISQQQPVLTHYLDTNYCRVFLLKTENLKCLNSFLF